MCLTLRAMLTFPCRTPDAQMAENTVVAWHKRPLRFQLSCLLLLCCRIKINHYPLVQTQFYWIQYECPSQLPLLKISIKLVYFTAGSTQHKLYALQSKLVHSLKQICFPGLIPCCLNVMSDFVSYLHWLSKSCLRFFPNRVWELPVMLIFKMFLSNDWSLPQRLTAPQSQKCWPMTLNWFNFNQTYEVWELCYFVFHTTNNLGLKGLYVITIEGFVYNAIVPL